MSMNPQPASKITARRLRQHWETLCSHIGERRAGSKGDAAAANYILEHFRKSQLQTVHAEDFPCTSVARARADVRLGYVSKESAREVYHLALEQR